MSNKGGKSTYVRHLVWSTSIIAAAFCALWTMGTARDALLAPWFWVYIAAENILPSTDLGRWPALNFVAALVLLAFVGKSRIGAVLATLWIIMNMLSALLFLQRYQG